MASGETVDLLRDLSPQVFAGTSCWVSAAVARQASAQPNARRERIRLELRQEAGRSLPAGGEDTGRDDRRRVD